MICLSILFSCAIPNAVCSVTLLFIDFFQTSQTSGHTVSKRSTSCKVRNVIFLWRYLFVTLVDRLTVKSSKRHYVYSRQN